MVFCEEGRVLDGTGLCGCSVLRFSIQALSASSGAQRRIEAERERGALRVGGGVGEDAKAARESLDVVEQQRRTIRLPGGDLGDAADLEARIGALDPPQRRACRRAR